MENPNLKFMLSICTVPTVIIDRSLNVIDLNPEAARLAFRAGSEVLSRCTVEGGGTDFLNRCFGSTNKRRFQAVLLNDQTVDALCWRLGGPFRRDELAMIQFLDMATARTHFVVSSKDLQHNKQSQKLRSINEGLAASNKRLGQLATLDQMTGLLNAGTFREAMTAQVASGQAFVLFYLDLNGLKQINDTLGHKAGDEAILDLANAVRTNTRQTDFAARLGGDEFALLVTGGVNREITALLAGRINDSLQHTPLNRKVAIHAKHRVAIGAAFWPQDASDANMLEHRADAAMYHSKRHDLPVSFSFDLTEQENRQANHDAVTNAALLAAAQTPKPRYSHS